VSRAGFVALGSVLSVAACHATREGTPPAIAPDAVDTAGPQPVLWDRFDQARSWPAATAAWTPSAGHGPGGWWVQVRGAPEVLASYRGLGPADRFSPGNVLAAFHRTGPTTEGPVFAMIRGDEGGWTFVATDPSGHLDPTADLALCERCHAEAPFDGLFGVLPPPGGPDP